MNYMRDSVKSSAIFLRDLLLRKYNTGFWISSASLFRGEYGLARTYWLGFIPPPVLFNPFVGDMIVRVVPEHLHGYLNFPNFVVFMIIAIT